MPSVGTCREAPASDVVRRRPYLSPRALNSIYASEIRDCICATVGSDDEAVSSWSTQVDEPATVKRIEVGEPTNLACLSLNAEGAPLLDVKFFHSAPRSPSIYGRLQIGRFD